MKAYLVLSGYAQHFTDFYVQGGLKQDLLYNDYILEILTLDQFTERTKSGTL